MDLSIIVPLAPNECLDSRLLNDLHAQMTKRVQPWQIELILVSLCEDTRMQNMALTKPLGICVRGILAVKNHSEDNHRATCLKRRCIGLLLVSGCSFAMQIHSSKTIFIAPLMRMSQSKACGLSLFQFKIY